MSVESDVESAKSVQEELLDNETYWVSITMPMGMHGSIRLYSLRFTAVMTSEVIFIRCCVGIRRLSDPRLQASLIFLSPDADTDIDRRSPHDGW